MSRYFVPITVQELINKISACEDECGDFGYNIRSLTSKVSDDLSKVDFDMENCDEDMGRWVNVPKNKKRLTGYQTLDNGLVFYGITAAGDWEDPLFFIIYWSGKELRGYIPTKGNTWNTINKKAIGNDEKLDIKFMCQMAGRKYIPGEDYQIFEQNNHPNFDYALLEKDIRDRILPKP